MNKDIIKLQKYFDSLNLRNEIGFKNAVKKIENVKLNGRKQPIKCNNDEIDFCINKDLKEMGYQAEEDSKMQIQPYSRSKRASNKICKQKNRSYTNKVYSTEVCVRNTEDENVGVPEIISYDKDNLKTRLDINYNITVNHEEKIKNEECSHVNNAMSFTNEFRTDLQSVLIMMAVNSNDNNNEYQKSCVIDEMQSKLNYKSTASKTQAVDFYHKREDKISEILCVIPLRTEQQVRYEYLARKVIERWKTYTNKRRQIKEREMVLNNFFEKLADKNNRVNQTPECVKKAKLQVKDYNTYQHRYKVQQNIIALQKMKLEEQTKLIDQLKYNKIIETSKESLEALRQDVSKTYYQIDPLLKPKIKCLTNELKIRELDEPSLVMHCLKVPQFIQRMEKRAREREEKHAMIRERRRQMEEERIRLKQQSELAKLEMDKEEKAKRIRELREKRKREKIENIRKKQHAERMRALVVMAEIHYERNLMVRYGINPLRRLMKIKQDNIEKARSHYMFQLKKNVFFHWMWHTEDMWIERNYKAEELYRKKILGKAFKSLKQNYREYKLKMQVAEDYYDLYVTQSIFRKFKEGIQVIQTESKWKWNKAVLYHNGSLLFKAFTCWRTLPALNALKREQDMRKLRWRERVLQVVPDYHPPEE